jgi:ribonuclease D
MEKIEKIRAVCHKVAQDNGLSTELILSRASIAKLAQNGPDGIDNLVAEGSILPWQADLIRQPLSEILSTH